MYTIMAQNYSKKKLHTVLYKSSTDWNFSLKDTIHFLL